MGRAAGEVDVPEIGPRIHLFAAVCGDCAAMVLSDGKKTYYTPIVRVTNKTAGKVGLWLFQVGERQEFREFELSRAKFAAAAQPTVKLNAKGVRLPSDQWQTPNVPSPQDWVLVLERTKP